MEIEARKSHAYRRHSDAPTRLRKTSATETTQPRLHWSGRGR
jgi:hypothetical protein